MNGKKLKKTVYQSGSTILKDDKQYYVCGDLLIEIAEYFSKNGKPLGSLIENVILHEAGKQ